MTRRIYSFQFYSGDDAFRFMVDRLGSHVHTYVGVEMERETNSVDWRALKKLLSMFVMTVASVFTPSPLCSQFSVHFVHH